MNYCGKYLDGFDYAYRALLMASGCDALPEISFDCISYRSFAFSVSDKICNFFSPAITWEKYLKNITKHLGLKEQMQVVSLRDISFEDIPKDTWVMFGETFVPWEAENVQQNFYTGCPSFFLCKVRNEREYLISNANVIPIQIISKDQIQNMIDMNCGFMAYFTQVPCLTIKDLKLVLWDAVDWRNDTPELWLSNYASSIDDFQVYKGKSKYSIQYGLMNYQLQVSKTIEFAHNIGCIDSLQYGKLLEMLYCLTEITETQQYSPVYDLDTELWEYLSRRKREIQYKL